MTHPPFCAGPAESVTDYMTKEGAHKLAALIRAAWARVGVPIETEIAELPLRRSRDRSVFVVRMPGLVNGLPARMEAPR